MEIKHRPFVFIIFVILFFISAPAVLLYANGYRYNFKKNKVEKTGSIVFSSPIDKINIRLDDNYYGAKNEIRIKNLLPGEYSLKLWKSGYFNWQKNVTVESGLSTLFYNLRLFQKNLPINLVKTSSTDFYPSPSGDKVAYSEKNNLKYNLMLFTVSDESAKKITELTKAPEKITWKDDEILLVKFNNSYTTIDIAEEKELPPTQATASTYNQAYEDMFPVKNTSNEDYLFTTKDRYLSQTDSKTGESIKIPLERSNYKIKNIIDNKIFIVSDSDYMQIFELPLQKNSVPILMANAKNFDLSGPDLLYYNDFEIWSYNFDSKEKELITRISDEIKNARWANSSNHIIFNSTDRLKIIEVDKRDKRQVFELLKFDSITDFILTKKYQLYFNGKVNQMSGIYKLEI